MTQVDSFTPSSTIVRRLALMFVGLAGVTAGLVVLFLCMRSVMEIGGSCASGNTPFEIRRQCPTGVAGLMIGSIFGGILFLGVYAVNAIGPNLTLLGWPALFISLGYNFADYGIDPPAGFGDGPSFGWLFCAVIFFLMGGVPLVLWIMWVLQKRESKLPSINQANLRDRLRMSTGGAPPPDPEARQSTLRNVAIALQCAAIVAGIFGGMELFEWATGSKVSFGFR
ncbi:MAG: hypothetical protein WD598_01255 [Acidimicrobiia bacterium]